MRAKEREERGRKKGRVSLAFSGLGKDQAC